jgi:hypothetical protein
MKKYIGICSMVLLAMFVASSINPADCFAWRQKYQQELTDNPKLDEANRLYKKAIRWVEDGDGVHESQRAVQFYANSESYLTKTILKLKELGQKDSIDVSKEVEFCEKLLKETHSKQGMAKRESR